MKYLSFFLVFGLTCSLTLLTGCDNLLPKARPENEILDGPIEGLNSAQLRQFLKGDQEFNDIIFSSVSGLGPLFVASSCGSCHAGDGKGHPFTTLTRFGQFDSTGNKFLKQGGPQLQNRAILGYEPELIPQGASFSKFTPPANTGLGFLELVSDADILAMSDPNDLNFDGISGVPNWNNIPWYITPPSNSISKNGKFIHRFGKKASSFNLVDQTVKAYNQDMGITSIYEPIDVHSYLEIEPEVSLNAIHDIVFYLQTLKAPIPRNQTDETVKLGKMLFLQIGCESCHKQTLITGTSPIEALSKKEFHPYTDLLLHDVGTNLDDGYTEGSALTHEWRTPPLWGLGLSPNSQGGNYFLLHDGRAKSIEEAILFHGGEAELSKSKYQNLSDSEKSALLKFLKSL